MKTKLISIILASVLISEVSCSAAGYLDGVLDNSLMNVTPSGTIVEKDSSGNIKSKTFYTTSVYFRFGPGLAYPEPIFNVSPPQISAGCSGLSIKGMFASIISLSQMEEQLKNAGASLAWGIVVGLIYSLPGIGAAFRMIDTWAKKIQQLLANACQMGQQLGEWAGKKGLKESGVNDLISGLSTDISKVLEFPDGVTNVTKGLDFNWDNMAFQSADIPPVDPQKVGENWKNTIINAISSPSISGNVLVGLINKMPNAQRTAFFRDIMGNFADLETGDQKTLYITLDGANSAGLDHSVLKVSTLLNNIPATDFERDDMAMSLTQAAIARGIGGDLIMTKSDFTEILKKLKLLLGPMTSASIKQKVSADLKKLVSAGSNPPVQFAQEDGRPTPQAISESLVRYLINGFEVGKENVIPIPALAYQITVLKSNVEDQTTTDDGLVFVISAATSNKTIENWFIPKIGDKGAKERSKMLIEGLTIRQAVPKSLDDLVRDSKIGLLVPGIVKKIKIIQQTPENDRTGTIERLIDYNTYHTVLGSIDSFGSNGRLSVPATPVFVFTAGQVKKEEKGVSFLSENLTAYQSVIQNATKKASEVLKESKEKIKELKAPASALELEEEFEKIDKSNLKTAIKEAPGK